MSITKEELERSKENALLALHCLYLAVEESVAKDVIAKVATYTTQLEGALGEKDAEIEALKAKFDEVHSPINIIFDGPPSHEAGRFVEVEADDGHGINVGEWKERQNGLWALRIIR